MGFCLRNEGYNGFFFSSRRRHTSLLTVTGSSDVCSSDLVNSAIVPHPKGKKRDRQTPTANPDKYRLFTEQPDEGRPLSKVTSRSELSNLWLATTILLVVVSAFGAGFLIMRPLLRR